MKAAFRVLVLVGLMIIIGLQLYNNNLRIAGILERAEREIEAVPVKIYTVKKTSPEMHIRAAGMVTPRSEVIVVSKVDGKILRVNSKVGNTIERNQVLAKVDDFFVKRELDIAKKSYGQLQADLSRYKGLSEENAISGQQMEQLSLQVDAARTKTEILERRLGDTSIKSPISGTLNQLFVKTGQSVGTGAPIAEIVNKDLLVIKAHLFRDNIDLVSQGMKMRIKWNQGILDATVAAISIKPDRTGKYPIEVSPIESSAILNPGMVVDLEGSFFMKPQLMIPERALTTLEGKVGVFISQDNAALFREVVTGNYYDRDVVILQGLSEGEQVVLEGNYFIKEGSKIKITP